MESRYGTSMSYVLYHTIDNLYCRYYARSGPQCDFFTVSIDGLTPRRLNASGDWNLNQQMIWSNENLGPGRHTVTLTHDDDRGLMLSLDFLRTVIIN